MEKDKAATDKISKLRKQAEKKLNIRLEDAKKKTDLSLEVKDRLLHELQVHQIELEMQNEELRQIQLDIVAAWNRYSDLYDFAPVGYLTVSEERLILEANITIATMLGVERSSLIGKPLTQFITSDTQDIYFLLQRKLFETKSKQICELKLKKKDSTQVYVHLEFVLVENVNRGTTDQTRTVLTDACERKQAKVLISITDITGRKQAEEEKLALNRQVQNAQKLESLGVLAGGIAHDFNNILAVILGNADLALYELSLMSPVRGYLQKIEKAVKHAAELVKQMLAYAGKGRYVVEPIDAGKLVGEIAHLLEVSISKKAELKYNLSENLPTFNGDVTQIRQIIINLIINASEAIRDKSGVITLSTGMMDCDRAYLNDVNEVLRAGLDEPLSEGVYTYIEVADTGCGMDAGTIEKIFDPFFTTKFTGRGLGMSAVLGIVLGHKGALKIYSEIGKGTKFKVLFPAIDLSDKGFAVRGKDEAEERDWRGSGTVLFVDDEENVRAVGKQMLKRMGLSVLTASDGREAVKVFRERADEIVCVLLDLTMPHMDGEETFREMRHLHPGVTVILCSGYNEQDATQRFAGKGLAGFIQKPYNMTALKKKLMKILQDQSAAPNDKGDMA